MVNWANLKCPYIPLFGKRGLQIHCFRFGDLEVSVTDLR